MSAPPQYLDPKVGDEHQSRFARELKGFSINPNVAEALKICAAIEWLRSVEGDSVQILCANPDPQDRFDQHGVICNGEWTGYDDRRYMGESVLAALELACNAREGRQRK